MEKWITGQCCFPVGLSHRAPGAWHTGCSPRCCVRTGLVAGPDSGPRKSEGRGTVRPGLRKSGWRLGWSEAGVDVIEEAGEA